MAYDLYPAVDETYNFPVEVRRSLASSMELRSLVIPMTTTLRNNLTPAEKWDGRVIANTTTDRLERYDEGTALWSPVAEAADVNSSQAAAKAYVDTTPFRKNRIINGNFAINQRGSASVTASGGYLSDRWVTVCVGPTFNWTLVASTAEELPEGPRWFSRITIAGSAGAGDSAYLMQRIENVATLQGQKATLSFWAKADVAGKKVGFVFVQTFGSGGSAVVDFRIPTTVTLTTTWQRYSVTVDIPSIAGKTIVGVQHRLSVELIMSSGASGSNPVVGLQNGTFDFWGVQLEEGPVATPFEIETTDENIRRCRRFYIKFATIPGITDGGSNSAYAVVNCPAVMDMRQINSASVYQLTFAATSAILATNPPVNLNVTPTVIDIYVGLTPGTPGGSWLRCSNFVIDAELI